LFETNRPKLAKIVVLQIKGGITYILMSWLKHSVTAHQNSAVIFPFTKRPSLFPLSRSVFDTDEHVCYSDFSLLE